MISLKPVSPHFLSIILLLLTGACESSTDVPVQQVTGSIIEPSLGDSVFTGGILDIERFGDRYYMVDDRSRIYILDSSLNLLRYKNVAGQGPGEIRRGSAIRTNDKGFVVFDSESVKFVCFNDSLDLMGEFQTSEISPNFGFNFLIKNSSIYTAYNSTNTLISVFDIESDQQIHSGNKVPSAEIGNDLLFFKQASRSQSRDNLYHIHKYGDDILLVNRFNPLVLVLSNRNGTYEVVHQYYFEEVAYFKDVIQSNEDFHRRKENVNSWKILATDSEIYNNKLVLLITIEEEDYEFFSHILVIEMDGNHFIPKQIYELGMEGEEMPWIRKFSISGERTLLCVEGLSNFVSYDINLNE